MDAEKEDRAKRTIEFLVKRLRSRADDVAVDFDEDGLLQYVVTGRPCWSGNVVVKPRGDSYYFWLSRPSCLEKTLWQETLSQLLGSTISLAGVDGGDVQIGELEIPATREELEIALDLNGCEERQEEL
jgi:hypothetical protein